MSQDHLDKETCLYPTLGKGKSELKIRLLFLVIFLIGILGARKSLYQYIESTSRETIIEPDSVMVDPELEPLTEKPLVSNKRPTGLTTREKTLSALMLSKKDLTREQLAEMAPVLGFSLNWLQEQPAGKPATYYQRWEWNYRKLLTQPERWLLQPIHIYGMLAERSLFTLSDKTKLHLLALYDPQKTVYFAVLAPALPQNARLPAAGKDGSFLACDALFLGRFIYTGDKRDPIIPLFITSRPLLATAPPTPPDLLDERHDPGVNYQEIAPRQTIADLKAHQSFLNENIFSPSADNIKSPLTPATGRKLADPRELAHDLAGDKPALNLLFQYVYGLGESLKKKVDYQLNYQTLIAKGSQISCGTAVYFAGKAGAVDNRRFVDDGSGINRLHLLSVHDSRTRNFSDIWTLAVLNLPPGLRQDDAVEAEGVFVKLYPYLTVKGEWNWAPLLVCREIRLIPRPGPDYASYIIVTALVLAGILIAVVASWHHRRHYARMMEKLAERRKQ